ncbi:hypothetical protein D0B54_23185 [Solimonas sp. K1W22B-7]|uniref:hypothetical protein n=1 Tax=Solimonas sp. K1W22B-7 TaxID=2303331 RepID=UPI000E3330BA|nr:hypothetical protein [Solimonas sp. K1W22B-7]AXQ31410.1 hypothetical protein D0B54_23185 [Solimonas sp. K1W22B-7]
MRKSAILFAGLFLFIPASFADKGGPPPASSKTYGKTLVAEFDLPDDVVERFNGIKPPVSRPDLSPLENMAFADGEKWLGEDVQVESDTNPHTLVVTLKGMARQDGDMASMWMAGWVKEGGMETQKPVSGLSQKGVKAGEGILVTATGGGFSFKESQKAAPVLTLIRADNIRIESVHVQVWSGMPNTSLLETFLSLRMLWIAMAVAFLLWFLRRK